MTKIFSAFSQNFVFRTQCAFRFRPSYVNRSFNRDIIKITKSVKQVFESIEKVDATLMLVAPSYYLLMKKFAPSVRHGNTTKLFKENVRLYLDSKFWTSINALHWMATFLNPSFKNLEFIPQITSVDNVFKRDLLQDLDNWMMQEVNFVTDIPNASHSRADEQPAGLEFIAN